MPARVGWPGVDDGGEAVDVLLRRQVAEERLERLGVDGLLGDELLGEGVEPVAMGLEDLRRPLVGLVDDRPDLLVDRLGDLVGVVALLADLAAEEHQLVALPEGQRAEPSLMPNSVTIRRARSVAFSMSLLAPVVVSPKTSRSATLPPSRPAILSSNSVLRLEVAVLGRQGHRVAEGHAAADDRDLVDRVALGQDPLDDGVTALVVGDDRLLGVRDDPRLALGAGDDPLEGLLEVGHPDDLLVAARGEDRGLVDEVGEVRAGEAGRLAGDVLDVDALVERLALGVDLEDRDAALHVGPVEDDLAVEPARAQERRVEDVGAVRGGDDDDVRVRVEAVHLDEDLVEGLLALVVAAAEAGAALAADRVDLVHEDDARASCAWPGRTGRGRGWRRRRRTSRRTPSRRC